jgi:nitrogen fixation protein FixH
MKILTQGKFTGWHMTTILVIFFGVVMAVNFTMARMAVGTFGGTVVDNSYVASQQYNQWLDAAARQDKLGWKVGIALSPDRHVVLDARKGATAILQIAAFGDALHPLGRADDIPLTFSAMDDGRLRSEQALPVGRWNLRLSLRRGADLFRMTEIVS